MDNLSPATVFRINTPKITHQTIDGESIIIDFEDGSYFSTDSVGAVIWEEVAQNTSVNGIVTLLTQRYAGESDVIQQAVEQFLIDLQHETLIVPVNNPAEPHATPAAPDSNLATRLEFQMPVLNKYTDMQDLLLLDPIHDVDEQGWPMKKEATSE